MIPPSLHSRREPLTLQERLVLVHVAVLVLFTAAAFGGQTGWARNSTTVWALGGGLGLTLRAIARSNRPLHALRRWLAALWPLAAFAGLAWAGIENPAFSHGHIAGGEVFVPFPPAPWIPSAARPDLAWRDLALFGGIAVATANLRLSITRRRSLRQLVGWLFAAVVILAVMGTVQKLLGMPPYFGAALSPNLSFFSTFLYHNHWSAFALLSLAAGTALVFHSLGRTAPERRFRSPAAATGAGLLAIAATLPACASRSGTAAGLLFASLIIGTLARRRLRLGGAPVSGGVLAVVAIAGAGAVLLAWPAFSPRLGQTREQIAQVRAGAWTAVDDRPAVYAATVEMFMERPLFGWGISGFGTVFPIHRQPGTVGVHYEHAHSDWLQSLAENGLVGTLLLLLLAARFLMPLRWRELPAFSGWLLAGCAAVVLYGALEFPFENPAVLALWWTLFFSAVRYARLSEVADDAQTDDAGA